MRRLVLFISLCLLSSLMVAQNVKVDFNDGEFFLAEEELVQPVLAAIHRAGRLDEHGTGVVFVLPVEQVAGIKDEIVRRQLD